MYEVTIVSEPVTFRQIGTYSECLGIVENKLRPLTDAVGDAPEIDISIERVEPKL